MIITRNDYNTMPEQVQENKDNIEALDTAVETAQTDVENLQTDVGNLQTDVGNLQTDVGTIQNSKPVYAGIAQSLTPAEQLQARQNIGAGASGFSGDYNDLSNVPIIKDDLNNIVGETAGKTYLHTGTTTAQFTNGFLYFYTGLNWKLITNYGDLEQAQNDITSLQTDVGNLDNDINTVDNAKADKDASNLSSSNVTSWKNSLNFESVDLLYDKDNADSSINWGYTSGISPNTSKTIDLTKYKRLRGYALVGYKVLVYEVDLEHLTWGSDYNGGGCFPLNDTSGLGALILWANISVNSAKSQLTCKSGFHRLSDNSMTDTYTTIKIEGVY